jgi:hypothetical protein
MRRIPQARPGAFASDIGSNCGVHPRYGDPKFSSSNTETRRTQIKTKDWVNPGAHPSGADSRFYLIEKLRELRASVVNYFF